jgi:hypothetical protein
MKMAYVLIAAIATSAAVGAVQSFAGSAPSTRTEPPVAAMPEAPAVEAAEASDADALEGEVLEATDVPNYSYYRIGARGSEGTWVAVPSAQLKVGERARVRNATRMTDFSSTTLKRTFPVIYFGTLEGGASPHGLVPAASGGDPHARSADPHARSASDPHAMSADPHAGSADPHRGIQQGVAEVKPVSRAPGPDGKTVAEVIGQRSALAGKTVRVHATVVKSTPGVLGRTYLHLRDGSGDAAAGTHDLAATTAATPAVGDVVIVEGVVAVDRDIGSGYKFPTIVEDATIVSK